MTTTDYLQLTGGCVLLVLVAAALLTFYGLKRGVRKLDGDTRQLQPPELADPPEMINVTPAPTRPIHGPRSILPRVCPLVLDPGHATHVWTFTGYVFRCPGYRGDPDPTRQLRRVYPDRDHKRRHRGVS